MRRGPSLIAPIDITGLPLAGSAAGTHRGNLAAKIGPAVAARGERGKRFVARCGSLSDGSLHFVRVKLPDGREYTLPQVVSASGVRYADDANSPGGPTSSRLTPL